MMRREFLGAVAASAAAPLAAGAMSDDLDKLERPKETVRGDMRYRELGRTGEVVSIIGVGGHHIGRQKEEKESIAIIRAAIDAGVTFMDNCWDYHDGGSEIRMGKALQDGYRKKVFLMTKIDGRTRQAAAQQLDQCLERLQTDVIDLLQFHEILRMEDPDRIFAKHGAMEAVRTAKKAGKVRFIGFTGHKDPLVHLRMLEVAAEHDFHFDTVQMPLNVMDAHFRSFSHKVVPVLGARGDRRIGDEVDGRRRDPQEQDGDPGRVSPLRHEPADGDRHHRHRQPENPQAGPGSGQDVPATEPKGAGRPARKDHQRLRRWPVRAVQDHQRIRRNRPAPRLAGRSRFRARLSDCA